MGARFSSEDSVFVLNGEHVHAIDVQKVRRAPIRRDVALSDFEAHTLGVRVMPTGVVHRDNEAVCARQRITECVDKVGCERRDPALARQVIAQDRKPVE